MTPEQPSFKTSRNDFPLSWDRLGFRLLVFGGLGLLWIIQGRMMKLPWPDLIKGELGGMLPWVFLAPIVLAMGRRVRIGQVGLLRFVGAHFLGMLLVFVPYWLLHRSFALVWDGFALGWGSLHWAALIPKSRALIAAFGFVPLIYLLILFGAEAMQQAQARREEERQAGRLAGQLAEARLALLQRQLHPHFLFNALQAISTLLHRDPAMADGLLLRLSTLLRAMLEQASAQTLSLGTELELTRKYLDIEQVRFADRLSVEWRVDESLLGLPVPSLVVLPLVENAIRHGLSPKVGPGRLTISAAAEGAYLILTVEDDGLGAALPIGSGVGIGNTRERLEAMYGGQASLTIDTQPEGGFRAQFRIPLPEKAA